MDENLLYIDKLLSLTKDGYDYPFRLEWTPLYGTEKQTIYIENRYYPAGSDYQEKPVITAGESLREILELLWPTIEGYPYTWPLEGEKLDPTGYDFQTDTGIQEIEIGLVAKEEVWRRLGLTAAPAAISSVYTQPETVSGGHLTKCSLTLEKASPISLLSFQMQSTLPVRLASLLYEADISGYSEAQKVDLEALQVEQSSENITLLFGKPLFAKRLTFVLAQDNAKANAYLLSSNGEDFTYASTEEDLTLLEEQLQVNGQTTVYTTNTIYTDDEIKDWSAERKAAYLKWRALKLASNGK